MENLRKAEKIWSAWPLRTRQSSSRKITSLFPIPPVTACCVCEGPTSAMLFKPMPNVRSVELLPLLSRVCSTIREHLSRPSLFLLRLINVSTTSIFQLGAVATYIHFYSSLGIQSHRHAHRQRKRSFEDEKSISMIEICLIGTKKLSPYLLMTEKWKLSSRNKCPP